ncbi:hypothetical protein K488DRAFT_85862 [Vararia minispora EC-137]|uniref:Uncharacterized protein n=1 Tax=Vararia minispora EC-137 TaxID=1314806 RepID=A0ACB8QLE8_9AGAM|nr:hypothetical protein K488DRAFT_85862 [Vararia minispora EC-137]
MSEAEPINFDSLWAKALKDLKMKTGIDRFVNCQSGDDSLFIVDGKMQRFKKIRAEDSKWGKLRNKYAKPSVDTIINFVGTTGDAASHTMPGGKAILVGFGVLLTSTKSVT